MFTALVVSLSLAGSPAPEIACVPWADDAVICRIGPEGTGTVVSIPPTPTTRTITRIRVTRRPLYRWEKILRIAAWVSVPVVVAATFRH